MLAARAPGFQLAAHRGRGLLASASRILRTGRLLAPS